MSSGLRVAPFRAETQGRREWPKVNAGKAVFARPMRQSGDAGGIEGSLFPCVSASLRENFGECVLPVAGYGLHVTSYGLRVAGLWVGSG